MSISDLDTEVAVREVMTAYMAACDAHDADAVAELFHPDALWQSLAPGAAEPMRGREAIRVEYAAACARLSFCVHYLTSEHITIDASGVHGRWSYFEPATNRGELALWTAGRYFHDFTQIEGVWRFATFRILPVLAAPYAEGWGPRAQVSLT